MIKVAGVGHRFRSSDRAVLTDIDLDVRAGERIAIIGESGGGKSTLLSIIAGLLLPQTGRVDLDGVPINSVQPHERRFAIVFQSPPRMPGIRVGELITRPARRDQRAGATDRVENALRAVGLDNYTNRRLDELSGGEQQRSFLARTLVWKPRFILLDEPFSNVDVQTKRSLIPTLLAHQASSGAGLVLITHDAGEAALIADRYFLLQAGRVISSGVTSTAGTDPQSIFGALVFQGGTTNLLPAEITLHGDIAILHLLSRSIRGRFIGSLKGGDFAVAIPAQSFQLSNSDQVTKSKLAIPDGITWVSAGDGTIAIGNFSFGPLYAFDHRTGPDNLELHFVPPSLGLPVFDTGSGNRAGWFVTDPSI